VVATLRFADRHLRITRGGDPAAEELVSGPAAGAVTAGSTAFLGVAIGAASSAEWGSTVPIAAWGSWTVFFSLVTSGAVGEEVFECGALVCWGVRDGLGVVGRSCHDADGGEESNSDKVDLHDD